jgi:hypothetical protein
MSARKPWLRITTDTRHRIAVVRGADAYRVCAALSPGDVPPVRAGGGGWVVNLSVVADLEALAGHRGQLVVVSERKEEAA